MKLQTKIIIGILIVIGALVIIPLLLTNYLLQRPDSTQDPLQDPPEHVTGSIESEAFELEEGYTFERAMTWNLENHESERSVDRYRFERAGNSKGTFTISFYEDSQYTTFDEVIQARYGEGFIEESQDFELNGLPARRIISSFLDVGNSSDVLVELAPGEYVSLYSIHTPDGESSARILEEINLMQTSFEASS